MRKRLVIVFISLLLVCAVVTPSLAIFNSASTPIDTQITTRTYDIHTINNAAAPVKLGDRGNGVYSSEFSFFATSAGDDRDLLVSVKNADEYDVTLYRGSVAKGNEIPYDFANGRFLATNEFIGQKTALYILVFSSEQQHAVKNVSVSVWSQLSTQFVPEEGELPVGEGEGEVGSVEIPNSYKFKQVIYRAHDRPTVMGKIMGADGNPDLDYSVALTEKNGLIKEIIVYHLGEVVKKNAYRELVLILYTPENNPIKVLDFSNSQWQEFVTEHILEDVYVEKLVIHGTDPLNVNVKNINCAQIDIDTPKWAYDVKIENLNGLNGKPVELIKMHTRGNVDVVNVGDIANVDIVNTGDSKTCTIQAGSIDSLKIDALGAIEITSSDRIAAAEIINNADSKTCNIVADSIGTLNLYVKGDIAIAAVGDIDGIIVVNEIYNKSCSVSANAVTTADIACYYITMNLTVSKNKFVLSADHIRNDFVSTNDDAKLISLHCSGYNSTIEIIRR